MVSRGIYFFNSIFNLGALTWVLSVDVPKIIFFLLSLL